MVQVRLGKKMRVTFCSEPQWQALVGRPLLDFVHPEDLSAVRTGLANCRGGRQGTCIERVCLLLPDGEELWTLRFMNFRGQLHVGAERVGSVQKYDSRFPTEHTEAPRELALLHLLPVLRRLPCDAIYAIRERLLPIAIPDWRRRKRTLSLKTQPAHAPPAPLLRNVAES